MKNEYKWCEICNSWLVGEAVKEDEIVYIATMNLAGMCDEFTEIVKDVVFDFCWRYGDRWG